MWTALALPFLLSPSSAGFFPSSLCFLSSSFFLSSNSLSLPLSLPVTETFFLFPSQPRLHPRCQPFFASPLYCSSPIAILSKLALSLSLSLSLSPRCWCLSLRHLSLVSCHLSPSPLCPLSTFGLLLSLGSWALGCFSKPTQSCWVCFSSSYGGLLGLCYVVVVFFFYDHVMKIVC